MIKNKNSGATSIYYYPARFSQPEGGCGNPKAAIYYHYTKDQTSSYPKICVILYTYVYAFMLIFYINLNSCI